MVGAPVANAQIDIPETLSLSLPLSINSLARRPPLKQPSCLCSSISASDTLERGYLVEHS